MAVIDELIVRKGTTRYPIDSYDNKMIDKIVLGDQEFHFAKQKDLVGETSVSTTNAVKEPIISLKTEGNTFQQTYEGYNLLNKEEFLKLELRAETVGSFYGGRCISDENLHKMLKPNTHYTLSFEIEVVEDVTEGTISSINGAGFILWGGNNQQDIYFRASTYPKKGEVLKMVRGLPTSVDISVYRLEAYCFQVRLEDGTHITKPCIIRNVQLVENETIYDKEQLTVNSDFSTAEYNGVECVKFLHSSQDTYIDVNIPANKEFMLYFETAYPEVGIDMYVRLKYEDGTSEQVTSVRSSTPLSTFTARTVRKQSTKKVTQIHLLDYKYNTAGAYYFRNFNISLMDEKPYEKYVGGILSPNVFYPQEIKNSNNRLLPLEYQRVEYLTSNGNQFINTEAIPTVDTLVEIDCLINSGDKFVYGSRTSVSTNDKHCVNLSYTKTTQYPLFGNSSSDLVNAPIKNTTKYKIKNGKDGFYIDGGIVRDYGDVTFGTSTLPMYLFALNTPAETTSKRGFVGNIYSCKIYEGNTLIRDFIPCYRIADNVVGMYDLVNDVFYENQGTGKFSNGKNIYEGILVENHSPNLLQVVDSSGSITDSDGNVLSWEAKDGIVTVNGISNTFTTLNLNTRNAFSARQNFEAGTYTYTTHYTYNDKSNLRSADWQFHDNDLGKNVSGFTGASKGLATKTFDSSFFVNACMLYINSNVEHKDYKFVPALFKGEYATLADLPPYQPYFEPTKIELPRSVTKADGTVIELPMGKQGDKADKLIVDRTIGKVTYEQWVKIEPLPIESASWEITSTANQVKTIRVSTLMKNSFSNIDAYQRYLINKFKEIFVMTVDEVSFYQPPNTNGLRDWLGLRIPRDLLETQNSAGVKKWLQAQQDEGDPVLIHYALKTPITHDITDTELGEKLLGLATEYGVNNFEISSELPVTSLELSYWEQITP